MSCVSLLDIVAFNHWKSIRIETLQREMSFELIEVVHSEMKLVKTKILNAEMERRSRKIQLCVNIFTCMFLLDVLSRSFCVVALGGQGEHKFLY